MRLFVLYVLSFIAALLVMLKRNVELTKQMQPKPIDASFICAKL